MNEYFFHGKAYLENGAYREVSFVVKAESPTIAHEEAVRIVKEQVESSRSAVFDTMTKQ